MERSLKRRLAALDAIYRQISRWILFREEDSVLILPPNRVYKLGGSGAGIISYLQKGGRLSSLRDFDLARTEDLEAFFRDLVAASKNEPQNLEAVRFGFDFTRLPVLGELALTYRCNNACQFCYAACGKEQGAAQTAPLRTPVGPLKAGRGELSTSEAKHIIDIFRADAKIPFFSFTGGEPLLRPDLEELAAYAARKGLRINLISNGTLATAKRARSLRRSGIETAQISLESPDPAIHDSLCGREGAFAATVAGIRALENAGISVQTNSTLTRLNAESLLALPAFLKQLGVSRFSMNLFIPSGRGLDNTKLSVPYSETGSWVEALRAAADREGLVFYWYSPTPYCCYNPIAHGFGNKSCAALDGLIHVDPYGDILPCSSWPEPLGSLLDSPFGEVWFGQRSAYFKQKEFAPAQCRSCDKFVACQGACPLYWKALGTDELSARSSEGSKEGKE